MNSDITKVSIKYQTTILIFIFGVPFTVSLLFNKLEYLLLLYGLVILVFLVYKFPTTTFFLLLFSSFTMYSFHFTERLPDFAFIYNVFSYLTKFILAAMCVAVVLKFVLSGHSISDLIRRNRILLIYLLFAIWLIFEMLRNIGSNGIDSFKELFHRYLYLIVPLYTPVFIRTPDTRKKIFKMVLFFFLFLPMINSPVIGFLKKMSLGSIGRTYNAFFSLAIVYGSLGLLLAKKFKQLLIDNLLTAFFLFISLSLFLIHNHRSVWVATCVMLVITLWYSKLNIKYILKFIAVLSFFLVIIWIGSGKFGIDLTEYLIDRADDIFNPLSDRNTFFWRIMIWVSHLRELNIPAFFIGKGFDDNWTVYVPELNRTIIYTPHSLYIEIFIKTGIIGLLLHFALILKTLLIQKKWLAEENNKNDPEYYLIFLSFICLIASHVFYIVYGFEIATFIFIGLGIGALVNNKKAVNPS